RLWPSRPEAAGAHMAEGLYKTTGQVAVVIGNPGPGSANLLAGVITARHEGVPLGAITSQHRLGIVYPSPPSTFQGQDQLDVYRPVVKGGGPIFSWEPIPEVVRLAVLQPWAGAGAGAARPARPLPLRGGSRGGRARAGPAGVSRGAARGVRGADRGNGGPPGRCRSPARDRRLRRRPCRRQRGAARHRRAARLPR